MVVGIKLLGAAFVVGAAAYYGIILSQTYDNRYWQLRHLYSIFLQMKSEMHYMNTPLPECFRILGDNAKEPVKAWLLGISDRLENKEEVGFSIIWSEELDNLYNHCICSICVGYWIYLVRIYFEPRRNHPVLWNYSEHFCGRCKLDVQFDRNRLSDFDFWNAYRWKYAHSRTK